MRHFAKEVLRDGCKNPRLSNSMVLNRGLRIESGILVAGRQSDQHCFWRASKANRCEARSAQAGRDIQRDSVAVVVPIGQSARTPCWQIAVGDQGAVAWDADLAAMGM